ncbi:hypothetical protein [Corynebacterium xerosis]|uniref:hypothetical protein n=1 Tax=Corynebacterium xerosis TaxID=1725 RepID=UPI000627D064|nr:hypothetical protein [Corynebacterium xerosis]KKO82672.1 hypothetical protein WU86_01550 [Corynebacterium xerosis]SQB95839.1 Uncharacterised protein [Clostridium paraputrificum]
MNVTTQVRRSSIASTLAAAALVMAACTTEEASPETSESKDAGSIELGVTPDEPLTFDESGTARYTVDWTAKAGPDEECRLVLTVTAPDDQVINSVPVAGCDSSMEMTLVDGAGDLKAGEYRIELERDDERAETTVTVEK